MGSRHGRATFSVLLLQVGMCHGGTGRCGACVSALAPVQLRLTCLPHDTAHIPYLIFLFKHLRTHTPSCLQDLAVVVLLMLIPLLAPSPDGSSGGLAKIAQVGAPGCSVQFMKPSHWSGVWGMTPGERGDLGM